MVTNIKTAQPLRLHIAQRGHTSKVARCLKLEQTSDQPPVQMMADKSDLPRSDVVYP